MRKRLKTSAPFVPRAVRAKADAIAEFSSLQRQLLDLLRSARGLDLRKLKIISPFNTKIRYNSAFTTAAS